MSISDTIEAATKAVGSQKALAALLGIPESHISGFKKGRPCSYQKHAQIAAAAGLEEEARRILIEGIADQLDEKIPHEAEAKAGFLAMLKAFPKSLFSDLWRVQILAKHRPFCSGTGGCWMLQA